MENKLYTREKIQKMDSIRVLRTLLSKKDYKYTNLKTEYRWAIKISTPEFAMCIEYWMPKCSLDAMNFGVQTWSFKVTNSRGKIIMSSSSIHPNVSLEMGKMIRKSEEVVEKIDAMDDWVELERYASLNDTGVTEPYKTPLGKSLSKALKEIQIK